MSWLRVDDKFARHPKIAALSDREFRVWMRVLCYAAEYKTGGKLPDSALVEVAGLDAKTVTRYVTLALLDRDKKGRKGLHIHDWKHYNDPEALLQQRDRTRRYRDRHRDENVTRARARARVPVPSPALAGGKGRKGVAESAAPPQAENGRASLTEERIADFGAYVNRVWDEYPNKADLHAELTDRGFTAEDADSLIKAEQETRA